ncbi:ADP-ribose glycohydrolase OARD1-like [Athalia rosae]|uniref:ADP-ribose glycohydrolase OARD1-like n=1 Tax=Athalia rosae TaxID=37344 RepID=UPI002033C1B3|nr:ADP-ribose glycohydrolase OARD1-like [Athalia rosae]
MSEIKADLLKQKDNMVHCISADCKASQGIADQMVKKGLIGREMLQSVHPEITDVISTTYPGRTIYNLVTKSNYKSLCDALTTLKKVILRDRIKTLSIPKLGCGLDKLQWYRVKQMISYIFKDSD